MKKTVLTVAGMLVISTAFCAPPKAPGEQGDPRYRSPEPPGREKPMPPPQSNKPAPPPKHPAPPPQSYKPAPPPQKQPLPPPPPPKRPWWRFW